MDIPTIVGVAVAVVIGGGVLALLGLALRNTLNRPARKQRLRAKLVSVAEIKPGDTVQLVGQVKPSEALLAAPFSGRSCVAYEAAIEHDVDPEDPDSVLGGIHRDRLSGTLLLEDESGSVLVRLSQTSLGGSSRKQCQYLRDVPMTVVDQFLEQGNATYDDIERGFPFGVKYTSLPADYRAVEWLVTEGDRVAVVGLAALEPSAEAAGVAGGYREAPQRLVVGPEGELPVQLIVRKEEVAALAKKKSRQGKR
jgi:hypothetical protein